LSLSFLPTVQLRSIVDTTYIESIHERERGRCGDSGIHPRACCGRIAGVSRACRGRVALSDNINVSDISQEFLAMSNCIPWYPPSPELSSLTNHHW
jgi:hypothetical protein